MLASWLSHPRTRGVELDDPRTTTLRREIIFDKRFLNQIYREWYESVAASLPPGDGLICELGSGAGFLADVIPRLVTSEIFYCPGIKVVLDGCRLPFKNAALRAIVMTDVFHHLPESDRFLHEAARCVGTGGRLIMVEPWVSSWSRLIYQRLHHEPFLPDAAEWRFPRTGPLSGANGALPWIVFERDRARFEREFPEWTIVSIELFMPFRYLLSGGVSLRSFAPGWTFGFFRGLERALNHWMDRLAMFARIVLQRSSHPASMSPA